MKKERERGVFGGTTEGETMQQTKTSRRRIKWREKSTGRRDEEGRLNKIARRISGEGAIGNRGEEQ